LPNRVISTARLVRFTRLSTAQHAALSFETGMVFMRANDNRSGRPLGDQAATRRRACAISPFRTERT
jgi:hypothetical protein